MTKFKIILAGAIAIGGVVTSLLIQHRTQSRLRENNALLQQQDDQVAELKAEHRRLSNRTERTDSSPAEDQTAELVKLRQQAEALRKQTNELARQLAENRRSRSSQTVSGPDPTIRSNNAFTVVRGLYSSLEGYEAQLYQMAAGMGDARNLGSAVRQYAREHQGEFPTNFDQAATYFYTNQPLPRTSGFEIVFTGSRDELTNVPEQAVALLRERQAWPTPKGRWARIYVMVGGEANVVESNDNFQSWEAAHVLPPALVGK